MFDEFGGEVGTSEGEVDGSFDEAEFVAGIVVAALDFVAVEGLCFGQFTQAVDQT